MVNRMKDKMKKGEPVFGAVISIVDTSLPDIAQTLSDVGFDYLIIDLQHGPANFMLLRHFVEFIGGSETIVMARSLSSDPKTIARTLDMLVKGIVVPDVDSRKEAEKIVSASLYPPSGTRSINTLMTSKQRDEINEDIIILLMIETLEGLDNIDEIATVDGVDGILIGPNDLAASLGIFNEYLNPKFIEATEKIVDVCKKHKLPCGFLAPIEPPERPLKLGCKIFSVGFDLDFLRGGAIEALKRVKEEVSKI